MENNNICNEIILDGIVRVDIIPCSECNIPVPFSVPDITEIGQCTFGSPALTISSTGDADAVFDTAPTLKNTEKTESAGRVRTHELSVPVSAGFEAVRKASAVLSGIDFYILWTTVGGKRYMAYTLPNTSVISLEDQMAEVTAQTLKCTVKSMSGIIEVK